MSQPKILLHPHRRDALEHGSRNYGPKLEKADSKVHKVNSIEQAMLAADIDQTVALGIEFVGKTMADGHTGLRRDAQRLVGDLKVSGAPGFDPVREVLSFTMAEQLGLEVIERCIHAALRMVR